MKYSKKRWKLLKKMKKILHNFYSIIFKKMFTRKRTCWKYHYEMVQICKETDCVFTKCRICGQWKPSNLKNFAKETHANKKRELQPLCRECLREQQKGRNKKSKEEKEVKNVEQKELFDWKVFTKDESNETLETKLDKVISFLSKLWLK